MHYLTAHYLLLLAGFIVALIATFQWIANPKVNLLPLAFALFLASLLVGCASIPTWQKQLAPDGLATQAVTAVAEHYGGQDAGNLASAGLSATAEVLQGYVDKKPPIDIITQSPGVEGVSHILVDWLTKKGVVTQDTVNAIHKAAAFAARATWTKPK